MKEKELRNLYIYYNVRYLKQSQAEASLNAHISTGENIISSAKAGDIYKRYSEKYAKMSRKKIEAMIGELEGGESHD